HEMRSTVGALLLVHQNVLGEIGQDLEKKETTEETKTELRDLRKNVNEKLNEANENLSHEKEDAQKTSTSLRTSDPEDATNTQADEQRILPQSAAEGKAKATENKIEEVKKFLDLKRDKLGADVISEAERLLQSAQDSLNEGKTKINVGDNNDAFSLFQKAILLSQISQRLLGVAQEVSPANNLKFEKKIKTEGNETKFKTRIETENGQDQKKEEIKKEGDNSKKEEVRSGENDRV
ncbi:MAG: hypothetical protein Q7S70_02210, partial [bacterium]|nr:hypothetical protein [bacterium]